ncbi:MAG: HAD family hydrolase [Actinomycetota bacterium]
MDSIRARPRPADVVASDLDGTLLTSAKEVSPRSRRALAAVRETGARVVLATGRPTRYVTDLARTLDLDTPVVCANGAVLYDAARDEVVAARTLSTGVVTELGAALRARLPGVAFAVEGAREFRCERRFAEHNEWPIPVDAVVDDAGWVDGEPVAKLLVRHPALGFGELLEAAAEVLDGQGECTYSSGTLLEIAAPGVDKAAGLAEVVAGLGVEPGAVLAFGDMPNDIAMLAWAGTGVAVANAHPAVLEVADAVTASNDDDGVALALEERLAAPAPAAVDADAP